LNDGGFSHGAAGAPFLLLLGAGEETRHPGSLEKTRPCCDIPDTSGNNEATRKPSGKEKEKNTEKIKKTAFEVRAEPTEIYIYIFFEIFFVPARSDGPIKQIKISIKWHN